LLPLRKDAQHVCAVEGMLRYRGKGWESIILRGDNSTERWRVTLECRHRYVKTVGLTGKHSPEIL